jgi:prepilin-type N-terminal cleavage/methylation domain-containing protein
MLNKNLNPKPSTLNSQRGFTLIEILIVISIIGILASIVLVNLGGFRAKGRDARRIADLKTLQNTLELYYSSNNKYPTALSDILTAGIGVTKLPKDPKTNSDYGYCVTNAGDSYLLGATLEGTNAVLDSDEDTVPNGYTCVTSVSCDDAAYGYCIKF